MEQLPDILEYFIPGYIFITTYQLLTSRKSSSYQVILSVIVSYILKAICSIVHKNILTERNFTRYERVIILAVIAIVFSIILVVVTEWKIINNILLRINYKSIHNDIWQDVIDYKKGTTLRITCNDAIYTGVLFMHEEKGNDSWFVFDNYIIEKGETIRHSADSEYPARLAISIKDVKLIEIYYAKEKEKECGKKIKNIIKKYCRIKKKDRKDIEAE